MRPYPWVLQSRVFQWDSPPLRLEIALPRYDEATLAAILERYGLSENHWPYYLENWPATYALADFLGRSRHWPPETDILDLGCGGGLLACYLAQAYGVHPWCLDFNPEACALTALNLAQDGHVVCADFSRPPWVKTFDVILGGDILYSLSMVPSVIAFLDNHLAYQGEALISDVGRSSAEGFLSMADVAGFQIQKIPMTVQISGLAYRNIQVYALRRKGDFSGVREDLGS